jgi:hypothetical protein
MVDDNALLNVARRNAKDKVRPSFSAPLCPAEIDHHCTLLVDVADLSCVAAACCA